MQMLARGLLPSTRIGNWPREWGLSLSSRSPNPSLSRNCTHFCLCFLLLVTYFAPANRLLKRYKHGTWEAEVESCPKEPLLFLFRTNEWLYSCRRPRLRLMCGYPKSIVGDERCKKGRLGLGNTERREEGR